jgi:hypothetical protein
MTDKEVTVKKPSKKERALARRAEHERMVNITTQDVPLTLECPKCHQQQKMTLAEYFEKAQYDGVRINKTLYCETCTPAPALLFYKANHRMIALAGMNWQREQMGITKETFVGKLDAVSKMGDGLHPERLLDTEKK